MNRRERIVLLAAQSPRRSSSGFRRSLTTVVPGEREITTAEWRRARQSMIDQGLLTQDDRLTQAGRSALEEV